MYLGYTVYQTLREDDDGTMIFIQNLKIFNIDLKKINIKLIERFERSPAIIVNLICGRNVVVFFGMFFI